MGALDNTPEYNPLTASNPNVAPAPTGGIAAGQQGYNPLTGQMPNSGGFRATAPTSPSTMTVPSAAGVSPAAPGAPQGPSPAISQAPGTPGGGFTPQFQEDGGYNPLQYATLNTANQLANGFGANVLQTRSTGSGAPPPQNMLDMGGGQVFNAGLTAQNVARYGFDAARRMMEAEMALPGAYNPNWQNADSAFNPNNREGMFTNVSGGAQARGSGYSGPTTAATTPAMGPQNRGALPGNTATPAVTNNPLLGGTPYPSPTPAPRMQDPRFVGGGMGTFSNFANRNNFMGGGRRGAGGQQINPQSLLQALLGIDLGAGGQQALTPGQQRPASPFNSGLNAPAASNNNDQLRLLLSLLLG